MSGELPLPEHIERRIYLIRSQKVMLDRDLARPYGVTTGALNQAVKRNLNRFPDDFMLRFDMSELIDAQEEGSRSQIVILNKRGQNPKYPILAFTEQGVAMLSSVLRGERAAQVNIAIMRAFMKLRELLAGHKELAKKLGDLERRYDGQFRIVFDAIRELMAESEPSRRIGFHKEEDR